jgi:hypothetical protein
MPFTQFMDMHSGGGRKLDWEYIYIEAPQAEAELVFYHRFGRNPHCITCSCCGSDYSLTESPTLSQATAYERGCGYDKALKGWSDMPRHYKDRVVPLEEYVTDPLVLVIHADEIKPEERDGTLPRQGWVWEY